MGAVEGVLDGLLSGADQAMVNAFTTGFRVAQAKAAIDKSLSDPTGAAAALESAQVVALGILVREAMQPAQFEVIYRPFATVLPGPGYRPAAPIDQQIAGFLRRLPTLKGEPEAEVSTVAKALSERPKTAAAPAAGGVPVVAAPAGLDPSANYAAAWKQVITTANQTGRTQAFRAMQDSAEQAAPHDGLGIVGFAGVAAGAIFMRDVLQVEKVLLLYEPFAGVFPYESLA
ncbi:MAG: hypothetical protein E6I89_04780 [Chloroflexi bacterium]|nr:MAG: hypothetical protein AUI15_30775 [Actinobacteria bacterium 13_2_20CM_2_66_6]TMD39704.1 MAG: hypothetical protein E6I89_04780 [Chloroflexota bacterium]